MSKTTTTDRVTRIVRDLLNKTVENGATEAEALAAAAKARELMDAHRLTMSDIEVQAESVENEAIPRRFTKRSAPADSCCTAIAAYCGIRIWYSTMNNIRTLRFFGLKADVEMAKYLYQMIDSVIYVESENFLWKTPGNKALNPNEKRHACWSHQAGMAARIAQRLIEMAREHDGLAKTGSGTALVVVKNAVVDAAFNKLGLNLTNARMGGAVRDGAAYAAGVAAGGRVNLNRPVGAGPAAGRLN